MLAARFEYLYTARQVLIAIGIFIFLGELTRDPTYYWEPRGAIIKPHLFDATLSPHGLRIELTPSMHVRFSNFLIVLSSSLSLSG